jgi:hypothetical protein
LKPIGVNESTASLIADAVPAPNTVSMKVYNLYSPGFPGLPLVSAYGAMQQIGHAGMNPLGSGVAPCSQPGRDSTQAEASSVPIRSPGSFAFYGRQNRQTLSTQGLLPKGNLQAGL